MTQLNSKSSKGREVPGVRRARIATPPLLIIGHQRSGTSAIASLLATASAAQVMDDPPWSYTASVQQVYGDAVSTKSYLEQHREDFEFGISESPGADAFGAVH